MAEIIQREIIPIKRNDYSLPISLNLKAKYAKLIQIRL